MIRFFVAALFMLCPFGAVEAGYVSSALSVDVLHFRCTDPTGADTLYLGASATVGNNCFGSGADTPAGQTRYLILHAGTLSGLQCIAGGAPGSGNSWTFRYTVNGTTQTTPTCLIDDTNTSCTVSTDTPISISNGDTVGIEVVEAGAGVNGGGLKCAITSAF